MSQDDKPAKLSDESLLRFLAAGTHIVRRGQKLKLRDEQLSEKSETLACPPIESYMKVVLGTAADNEAVALLSHASTCGPCGEVLAGSLRALDGDPDEEEAAAIAELAELAAQTEWQRKIACTLAGSRTRRRPFIVHAKTWMAGGAIAAGVLAVAGLFLWQRQSNTPEHQLAMAYTQARTLELRIPQAGYAARATVSTTRGDDGGRQRVPLLEARTELTRGLERSPEDARLLQLQARADVLERRYNPAVDVLDRLLAAGPVTAELLTDAASAYYQRGLLSENQLDRSTALEYLRRADELAPTDPVVLFNEAIVMEDRGQMMNAVEVWNRYLTVERDPAWAAEGKRKMAALEQTLNRLKSHDSRVNQILHSPDAMDALAVDRQKLATLDEELATFQLDTLVRVAYPVASNPPNRPDGTNADRSRGSPCERDCLAARKLLKAVGNSLEVHHQDRWLADLLSFNPDSLSGKSALDYTQALQILVQAIREDLTGDPNEGARLALQARSIFHQLRSEAKPDSAVTSAANAGEDRADVEHLFALQRRADFDTCRSTARLLRARFEAVREETRYPWIDAQELVTEKVCDETPASRREGRVLESRALHLSQIDGYWLMVARVETMQAGSAQDAHDDEASERLTLSILRQLYSVDPPALRVAHTMAIMALVEADSPRPHVAETLFREDIRWLTLANSHVTEAQTHMELARAEMRLGAMREADHQIQLANQENDSLGEARPANLAQNEIFIAQSMLDRADVQGARQYLDRASAQLTNVSDPWVLRAYAASRGLLELDTGHIEQASRILEADIRNSEGKNVRAGDHATASEYAQQDHDLYAELAAVWLAEGRSAESVLALWERFRLRSRGLPIRQCIGRSLDCEEPLLAQARLRLGHNILIGQILLLDRVLLYRVDRNGTTWTQMPLRQQDALDAAQTLERAVSSSFTTAETAARLSANLTDTLLPSLPKSVGEEAALLIEADPLLSNLSWPVLSTPSGPLGLRYPLAEVRSILAVSEAHSDRQFSSTLGGERALVVGASVAAEGEPPLPEALTEARAVGAFLHSPNLLLGEKATASRVSAALSTATVFHFAGHAIQTESGTELLLAASSRDDASPWLDGQLLHQHPPRFCRLAVLSACATGTREPSWNHPMQDLVETMGALGVPEIVATRWQIDSEAAVPFMDAFYRALAKGESVPAALTAARRLQSRQPPYNKPYYWGAYYITGQELTGVTRRSHAV
jgi:CHAT domain-containing protein